MTIAHITGGKGTGKSFMAGSFRATAVNQKRGTLLVDDHLKDDGATQHLLEKLIADGSPNDLKGKLGRLTDALGNPIKPTFSVDEINWKPSPVIIFIGDAIARLADIEAMVPGFTEKFGPVREQPLGDQPYEGEPAPEIEVKPAEYDLPLDKQVQMDPEARQKKIDELEARLAALREASVPAAPAALPALGQSS